MKKLPRHDSALYSKPAEVSDLAEPKGPERRSPGLEALGGSAIGSGTDWLSAPLKTCLVTAIALLLSSPETGQARPGGNPEQNSFYAPTSWPTVHADGHNSDFIPYATARNNRIQWRALAGAASILAPVIGPEGHLYITTGQGQGTSHLHTLDRQGRLLWQSKPQRTLDDLDSLALLSAPLIDREGTLYLSDSNQYWAFQPDGQVKWVAQLPDPGSPLISSILTPSGLVGGVTTNGKVLLFQRSNGALATPILQLPPGQVPPARPIPAGLWSGGFVDPSRMAEIVAIVRGEGVQVANTPAVHPQTGRIYIPAAGPKVGDQYQGRLYGIDLVAGELKIAFATVMGGGSGTSPTLSPDGQLVYAVDQNRVIYAFDTETGRLRWQTPGVASVVSPSVGPDGTIYAGNADSEQTLIALNQADGSIKWAKNYDDLAAILLPTRSPFPPYFASGNPIARYNFSTMSVAGNKVWVALTLGYAFFNPQTQLKSVQPAKVILAGLDAADGALISYTPLPDSCECVISIGADGSLYTHQTTWLSSIFFNRVNALLPPEWRLPQAPSAGITALGPVALLDLLYEGMTWVEELNQQALQALPQGKRQMALIAVRRGVGQLQATQHTLNQAIATGEIPAPLGETTRQNILQARENLVQVVSVLEQSPPNATAIARILEQLQQTEQILRQTRSGLSHLPR